MVYIDCDGGRPTSPTLFALSEARRVARLAGASLYAVALTGPLSTRELEALTHPVGEAGADKLLLCEGNDYAGPPLDFTHGGGLDAAAARVIPAMILFPAGGPGMALGPPLAARLGGPFAPWCDLLATDAEVPDPARTSRVQLIHCRPDGRSRRRLDPLQIERPIVATLGAGRRPAPAGRARDLEVEIVASGSAPPSSSASASVAVSADGSQRERLTLASVLVLIGDGDDGRPLLPVESLAELAPPGVAVVAAGEARGALLMRCCPEILLKIGRSRVLTARSPRTRVVLALVAPEGKGDPPGDDVDVVWQFPSHKELTARAVGTLLAQIGKDD